MMKAISTLTMSILALALAVSPAAPKVDDAKEATASNAAEEAFDVEVKITGNDQMQYDKKAFTVESGKKVKLSFKNVGKLPKAAMGHNVVILKKGVNKVGFATAAITAGPAADYLPADKKSETLAHTKMLGPGEEHSVVFTAPAPGKYDYICTFPGHFALMNGVMTVK